MSRGYEHEGTLTQRDGRIQDLEKLSGKAIETSTDLGEAISVMVKQPATLLTNKNRIFTAFFAVCVEFGVLSELPDETTDEVKKDLNQKVEKEANLLYDKRTAGIDTNLHVTLSTDKSGKPPIIIVVTTKKGVNDPFLNVQTSGGRTYNEYETNVQLDQIVKGMNKIMLGKATYVVEKGVSRDVVLNEKDTKTILVGPLFVSYVKPEKYPTPVGGQDSQLIAQLLSDYKLDSAIKPIQYGDIHYSFHGLMESLVFNDEITDNMYHMQSKLIGKEIAPVSVSKIEEANKLNSEQEAGLQAMRDAVSSIAMTLEDSSSSARGNVKNKPMFQIAGDLVKKSRDFKKEDKVSNDLFWSPKLNKNGELDHVLIDELGLKIDQMATDYLDANKIAKLPDSLMAQLVKDRRFVKFKDKLVDKYPIFQNYLKERQPTKKELDTNDVTDENDVDDQKNEEDSEKKKKKKKRPVRRKKKADGEDDDKLNGDDK